MRSIVHGRLVDGGEATKSVALEESGLWSRWTLWTISEEIKGNGMYDNGRSTNSMDSTTLKMEDMSKIIANIANPLAYNNYRPRTVSLPVLAVAR